MGQLSDTIVTDNQHLWDAMQQHRFVQDVAADRLPPEVFHRYLVFEGAFVATAIRIFSYGVAKAPDILAQRWLVTVLDALANQQIAYFERSFVELGIVPESIVAGPDVRAFDQGMLAIAQQGDYADIITAMYAAEWMYWHWCSLAAHSPSADSKLAEWIDLHAAPEFEAQARWLKAELDRCATSMSADQKARASQIFGRVLHLEIAFHKSAYPTDDPVLS